MTSTPRVVFALALAASCGGGETFFFPGGDAGRADSASLADARLDAPVSDVEAGPRGDARTPCHNAADCPAGMSCDVGVALCGVECGGGSNTPCNGGCCDATGTCAPGTAGDACGTNGATCHDCAATCGPGPACVAGGCGCSTSNDCGAQSCGSRQNCDEKSGACQGG